MNEVREKIAKYGPEAVRDEAKGPPVSAPDQAVDGFCRPENRLSGPGRASGSHCRAGPAHL